MRSYRLRISIVLAIGVFSLLACRYSPQMPGLSSSPTPTASATTLPSATMTVTASETLSPTLTGTPSAHCGVSSDPDYGFEPEKPVRLGATAYGAFGRAVEFVQRLADVDGNVLPATEGPTVSTYQGKTQYVVKVTTAQSGQKTIYLEVSEPADTDVPQGFSCLIPPTPTATIDVTKHPRPTATSTGTPVPDQIDLTLSDEIVIQDGEFAFRPVVGLSLDYKLGQVLMADRDQNLVFLFVSFQTNERPTLHDAAYRWLGVVFPDLKDLSITNPFVSELDGKQSYQLTFTEKNSDIEGQVLVAQQGNNQYWMGAGFGKIKDWEDTGKAAYELMLSSVRFNP